MPAKRPYLYELDRLRVVTACSVVAVHILANTTFLDPSLRALQVQNAFVTALHFTRATFLFVTAFALVYVYYDRPFSLWRFWQRRGLGVVLPYVIWSAVYIWVTLPPQSPLLFLQTFWWDLLTGNASYQLYYILLTIQFYLLFPWFLWCLGRVWRRPWVTLAVSFLLEVAMLYAIATYVQPTPIANTTTLALHLISDRCLLVYQFYVVLGAMAALYLHQMRTWVLQHGAWMVGGLVGVVLALELHYVIVLAIEQAPISVAVAVMQPIMAFYSVVVTVCLYWWAYRRVVRRTQTSSEQGDRIWRTLSNASFGVYLVHPLFLIPIFSLAAALHTWPLVVVVVLAWALAVATSAVCCLVLLHLPLLSRLVGRDQPLAPALAVLRRKLAWWGMGHRDLLVSVCALARREEGEGVYPREGTKQSKEGITR